MTGRPRKHRAPVCKDHPHGSVISHGKTPSGERQRFLCTYGPDQSHTFSIPAVAPGEEVVVYAPPPDCEKHPASKVTKAGTTSSKAKAQRYKCHPTDGSKPHTFTPPVARQHVHEGVDRCEHCARLRGPHGGQVTGGRYYRYPAHVSAGVLQRVGMGHTYVEASKWARRQLTGGSASIKDNGLAMGTVEAFTHVVWDPLAGDLVAREQEHRRRKRSGEDLPPSVLLIDDAPFDNQSFHVLVVCDITWTTNRNGKLRPHTQLRLARAMGSVNTHAWTLALSEIGAPPDYLVADGASAISASLARAFPHAEDDEVTYLPSIWHIKRNLTEAFFLTKSKTQDRKDGTRVEGMPVPTPVAQHLDKLGRRDGALADPKALQNWWTQLEALYKAWQVPSDVIDNQRDQHLGRLSDAIDALSGSSFLPASTGAIESIIRDKVKPFFHNREHSFANIERTNRALNLFVASQRGALDDQAHIAEAIRHDIETHEGRAVGQRKKDDPHYLDTHGTLVRHSSLRDKNLAERVAKARGLA